MSKTVNVLVAACVFIVAGTAVAQDAGLQRRQGSPAELIRESDRVNNLIRSSAQRLSPREIRAVDQALRSIEMTIAGNGPGRPDPGYPQPQPPRRNRDILVRGDVEGVQFGFEAESLDEIHDQCVSGISQSKADDIRVSVNMRPIRTLRNSSSYWTGKNEICNQIIQQVRAEGIEHQGPSVYVGSVEGRDFKFVGGFRNATLQCETFVNTTGLNQVDDIIVSIDYLPSRVLRNSSTYWKGSLEICQQIIGTR